MIDNDSLTRPITCQCMAAYTVVGYIKVSGAELAAYNDLHFTITNPCEPLTFFSRSNAGCVVKDSLCLLVAEEPAEEG